MPIAWPRRRRELEEHCYPSAHRPTMAEAVVAGPSPILEGRCDDLRHPVAARRQWAFAGAAARRLRVACPGARLPSLFFSPFRKGYGAIGQFAKNGVSNEKSPKRQSPPTMTWGVIANGCSAVSYFSNRVVSIIGAGRLSFRVRDGSGRFPAAVAAVTLFIFQPLFGVIWWWGVVCSRCGVVVARRRCGACLHVFCRSGLILFFTGWVCVSFRPVSASSLQPLLVF